MENENPTHNQEVLKDGKEIGVFEGFLYNTRCTTPHIAKPYFDRRQRSPVVLTKRPV